jgi:hypothetical protein
VLGVIDSYEIELIHPMREEGRTENQIGKKGLSSHRKDCGRKTLFVVESRGFGCGLLIVIRLMFTAQLFSH